jgi:hypothetical protein
MRKNLITIAGLTIILLIVGLAYLPGLNGPFVLDDAENISLDPSIAIDKINFDEIQRALHADAHGPLKRPLASLTFALDYYWAGGFESTWYFKITNLIIHAINTVLVYGVLRLLLLTPRLSKTLTQPERQAVALLGTALWAIHPIQLTNVLYVVQRMNSLSALFVLAGLILFLVGRQRLSTSPVKALWLMSGGAVGGMALGLTAKENAALIPLYLSVVEYTLFTRNDLAQSIRRQLYLFYAIVFALPVVVFATYIVTHPEFVTDAFATRQFTAYERLLTEGRILWYYVSLILVPSTERLGLFHDDIPRSLGLFDPFSTFIAASGIAVVLALSLFKAKRFPVAALAILWFLVGHSMESTIFDLELAFEHRNYLPSLGLFFALAYGLISLTKIGSSRKLPWYGFAVALVAMLGIVTWVRADSWKDINTFAISVAQHHPNSARANDFAARVSLVEKQDVDASLRYTLRGIQAAPQEVGFLIDLQILLALPPQYPLTVADPTIPPELTAPETITRLLLGKPLSVHGIISLENLRRCIVTPPYPCGSLRQHATKWLTVAADESRTSHEYRGILAADAARLFASAGNYKLAYTYMKRASAEFPDLISYKLGLAEYSLRLGCLEQTKFKIEQIEQIAQQKTALNQTNQASLDELKEMYSALVKQGSGTAHIAGHLCYKIDK